MRLGNFFSERMNRLTMLDIKLAQGAAMCFMAIVVKLFPSILNIHTGWFVFAVAVLGFKPLYVFYGRNGNGASK